MSLAEACISRYQQEIAIVKQAPFAVAIASLLLGAIGVFLFHISMFAIISMKDSQLDTQDKEIGRLTKAVAELSAKELQGLRASKQPTAEDRLAQELSEAKKELVELKKDQASKNQGLDANGWSKYVKIPVVGKTYRNETVPLDGYSYSNCTFINVMFEYSGRAPFDLVHNNINGAWIDLKNPSLLGLIVLLKELKMLKPGVPIER